MLRACDIAFIAPAFPESQTLSSQSIMPSFSCMGVFGIGTKAADLRRFQRPATNSGKVSSLKMYGETQEIYRH